MSGFAVATVSIGLAAAAAPATKQTGKTSDKPAIRGEYLARAADCQSCHTRPGARPYSGGEALKTPFGEIYAPNITQDPKTGIGGWSKDDFARALREGRGKGGELLYPAMPYTNYTKIADADIDALWAYFLTIPPVEHTAPENTFPFPLNLRSGLAVWQSLYFEPARFAVTDGKGADWNRGAYLVEGFGHCGACHTPRNLAMAPEQKHRLTGTQITGWYAPDISNDPMSNISKWDVDKLAKFLKTGESDNVKTFGPMQQVIQDSLRFLSDADLRAMSIYLKDLPGSVQPRTVTARVAVSPERLAAGKAVYVQHCDSCHGADGRGSHGSVPALAGNTAVSAREPYNVIMATLEGFDPQDEWGAMPSFANVLGDQDIADVSTYVRSAWGNDRAAAGTAAVEGWTVAGWRSMAQVPASGQRKAVICPSLPADVLAPALKPGAAALEAAGGDHARLLQLVDDYTAARPQSSPGQVIEALSTAYCRAVVDDDKKSAVRTDTRIAQFAQNVAIALANGGSADRKAVH